MLQTSRNSVPFNSALRPLPVPLKCLNFDWTLTSECANAHYANSSHHEGLMSAEVVDVAKSLSEFTR